MHDRKFIILHKEKLYIFTITKYMVKYIVKLPFTGSENIN